MITIEKSSNADYFAVDGVSYPKYQYFIKYDNIESGEAEMNFSLCSVHNGSCIIESRGFAEIAGALSWFDLLYILSNVGAIASNDVAIQDQTTEIIDLHMTELIQEITIVNQINIDDQTIVIHSAVEPINDHVICLRENSAFFQGEIISHSANGLNWNIILDVPIDYAFSINAGCSERNANLAVNGSVTKRYFKVSPSGMDSKIDFDITRMLGSILDASPMDDSLFGGIPALSKGIVFRTKNSRTKNIFSVTSNGDIKAHCYDLNYSSKAPSGFYGLNFMRSFAGQDKNGVAIRLHSETNDEFICVIQDDLTGLNDFELVLQGHIVQI